MAGKDPSLSREYTVTVDTTAPTFLQVLPPEGEVQAGTEVTLTVELTDTLSGVDPAKVYHRFGTSGEDSMGDWIGTSVQKDGDTFTGTVVVKMARGRSNYFQLKAVDNIGNEALIEPVNVWVNRLPVAMIKTPKDGLTHSGSYDDTLDAEGSYDPDGDDLIYQWWIDDDLSPIVLGRLTKVHLAPGTSYNITLVVIDPYGGEDRTSVNIKVESTSKDYSQEIAVLLVILAVLVVTSVALFIHHMKNRT
jgi:hypothetical protein